MDRADRIAAVQKELVEAGHDYLLVPMADEFQTEFVPAAARRIEWLTGFTGSRALAVLSQDQAWLFVPTLYEAQAQRQLANSGINVVLQTQELPFQHLNAQNLSNKHDQSALVDSRLITGRESQAWRKQLSQLHIQLVEVTESLIDRIWEKNSTENPGQARPYSLELAGESSQDKRRKVADFLDAKQADFGLITASDSIAWLLNIRGRDVPMATFVLSYFLIDKSASGRWYVDEAKVTPDVRQHLGEDISIRPIPQFWDDLRAVGQCSVAVDTAVVSQAALTALESAGAKIIGTADPCQVLKAAKNPIELARIIDVHIRDGVALSRYLHWLEEQLVFGPISELDAAEQLRQLRARDDQFDEPSFGTISAAGPNAALPHYQPTEEEHSLIQADHCYLVDSGGQYRDGGTTDVTRTIWLDNPPKEFIELNTRVLKGMIAVASVRFPLGTHGEAIDPLARQYLWEVGKDYGHGTGHGVGAYLNVHEGPQYITSRKTAAPLEVGNVLSNEPGYYRPGNGRNGFGIRIENLQYVQAVADPLEQPMLEFVPLTLAPIDTRIINAEMLTARELAWLNNYHQQVLDQIMPCLSDDEIGMKEWLEERCRAI